MSPRTGSRDAFQECDFGIDMLLQGSARWGACMRLWCKRLGRVGRHFAMVAETLFSEHMKSQPPVLDVCMRSLWECRTNLLSSVPLLPDYLHRVSGLLRSQAKHGESKPDLCATESSNRCSRSKPTTVVNRTSERSALWALNMHCFCQGRLGYVLGVRATTMEGGDEGESPTGRRGMGGQLGQLGFV